ncbi:MAG TPA: carbohydrate ABC transporter permease [Candidatus Faecivivens stercorigallinarum]|nr:carbohydrate ABC transporter permease [Candidatus Faecivivens stercorigallinarum]
MTTIAKPRNKVQRMASDKVFNFFLYLVCGIGTLIVLYPMYFIIIASFSDPIAVSSGNIGLLPVNPTLDGYKRLISYDSIWLGYRNTILYTLLGTLMMLAVNIPAAYALSRKDLVGRRLFNLFLIIPMFFTGGLIPTYMIVKDFNLVDNFWVMIIPFSVVTYYIIVARTFFESSLPDSIWEAAQIDGCGNLRFFFSFALPLSKAIIAVIGLWAAVGIWNQYFNALIYLRKPELQPLQIILRSILISNQNMASMTTGSAAQEAQQLAELIKYAVIVVSSAPIMCLYPFVQKYFSQGVMIGAVKG